MGRKSEKGKCMAYPPKVFEHKNYSSYGSFIGYNHESVFPVTRKDDFCMIPNTKQPVFPHSFPNVE